MKNPFQTGRLVKSDQQFRGRRSFLEKLWRYYQSDEVELCIVSGPRRIGKSSLLARFASELKGEATPSANSATKTNAIHIDLSKLTFTSIDDEKHPLRIVLDRIWNSLRASESGFKKPTSASNCVTSAEVESLLSQVRDNNSRLVLLFDEVEKLDSLSIGANSDLNDTSLIRELIDFFIQDEWEFNPFIVLCWGRPLTTPPSQDSLHDRFKFGKWIGDVGLLSNDAYAGFLDGIEGYKVTSEARERIEAYTKRHPYYVSAIHSELFESIGTSRECTAIDVDASVLPAVQEIYNGLHHSWLKGSSVSPLASHIGWAVAKLTLNSNESVFGLTRDNFDFPMAFSSGVTESKIVQFLKSKGVTLKTEELNEHLPGLIKNLVVRRNEDQTIQVCIPFLGFYLCRFGSWDELLGESRVAFEETKRGLRQQILSGQFEAASLSVGRVSESYYSDREFLRLAIKCELKTKSFRSALMFARIGVEEFPDDFLDSIPEVLYEKMKDRLEEGVKQTAHREGSWAEFKELSKSFPSSKYYSLACNLILDNQVQTWEEFISNATALAGVDSSSAEIAFGKAQFVLEFIEEQNIPNWGQKFVDAFFVIASKHASSENALLLSYRLIHDCFIPATVSEGSVELAQFSEADVERELEQLEKQLGGLTHEQQEQFRRTKIEAASYPWWGQVASVLKKAWENDVDPNLEILSPNDLANLLFRAPVGVQAKLQGIYDAHLPDRLASMLSGDETANEAAVKLTRFLLDTNRPQLKKIEETLYFHGLTLAEESNDPEQLGLFVSCTGEIYNSILETYSRLNRELDAKKLVESFSGVLWKVFDQRAKGEEFNQLLAGCTNLEMWPKIFQNPLLVEDDQCRLLLEKYLEEVGLIDQAGAASSKRNSFEPADEELNRWLGSHFIYPVDGDWHRKEYRVRGHVFAKAIECFGEKKTDFTKEDSFQPCRIKILQLTSGNSSTESILLDLWERERRILSDISTRKAGRGLPKLVESFIIADDGNGNKLLVVVTEGVYHQSLRDLIAKGPNQGNILDERNRGRLWEEICGLVESVNALHEAGYIHRDIRPENILVFEDGHQQHLKLANFELSVFLKEFATRDTGTWRADRYVAPEAIANPDRIKNKPDSLEMFTGENVASDVYSLGLVLFEVFIERLTREEITLNLLDDSGKYDFGRERKFVDGLKKKVEAHAIAKVGTEYFSDEAKDMINGMLTFDLVSTKNQKSRSPNLQQCVSVCKQFAFGLNKIQQDFAIANLQIASTCRPGDKKSIGSFLGKYLGLNNDATKKIIGSSTQQIVQFLQNDLNEMRVYRNANSSRPLIIEGKKGVYTVSIGDFNDKAYSQVPFLQVVKPDDRKIGEALVSRDVRKHKQANLKVWNLSEMKKEISGSKAAELKVKGTIWHKLFEKVLGYEDHLSAQQRAMHAVVDLSIRVEQALWERYLIPYEVLKYVPAKAEEHGESKDDAENSYDGYDKVVIIDRKTDFNRSTLLTFVVQQIERQNLAFDLIARESALSAFDKRNIWNVIGPDALVAQGFPKGSLVLMRKRSQHGDAPPDKGWLRPKSLEGSRRIRDRRRDLSRRLEDDSFLLTAVTEPWKLQDDGFCLDEDLEFHNSNLDSDKKKVVRRVLNEKPLLTLQGPPGTGKTTLAVEVIMQLLLPSSPLNLNQNSNKRVLVTSQAHDPLNHMMKSVESKLDTFVSDYLKEAIKPSHPDFDKITRKSKKDLRERWEAFRPIAIRIVPDRKLREGKSENAILANAYHPSNQAKKIFQKIANSKWKQDGLSKEVFEKWKQFVHSTEEDEGDGVLVSEIEDRLVESANIVYVAANDRTISELPEHTSFDLLVYEEAGKSIPAEILGPMRLARHWLLIGDHCQLPPFDIENFSRLMIERCGEYLGKSKVVGLTNNVRKIGEELAASISEFFKFLHTNPVFQDEKKYKYRLDQKAITNSEDICVSHISDVLTYQWRMHPDISAMLRDCGFYEFLEDGITNEEKAAVGKKHRIDRLEIRDGDTYKTYKEISKHAIVWLDCPHASQWESDDENAQSFEAWGDRFALGGGFKNYYEAKLIQNFLQSAKFSKGMMESLMILSPYRAQVGLLKKFFTDVPIDGHTKFADRVFTVDSAQGREAEVVIVSLVRNNPNEDFNKAFGFLRSIERLGVMFSRAERLLVIAGSSKHFKRDPNNPIGHASDFVANNGLWINATEIIPNWAVKRSQDKDKARRLRSDENKIRFRESMVNE